MNVRLQRVRATAYSKLTLSLRVLGTRDDGYHELEALTLSIGQPHDVVEATAVPHPGGVTFEMEGEVDNVPAGMDNLAARAAEDVMLRAGRSGHGVRLVLRKRIPAGATGPPGGDGSGAAAQTWHCVSNLPYNVATPVVVRLLEECPRVMHLLLMVQREVGERLAARPGTGAYGAVSVKVAYYTTARVVGTVPATVFVPTPNVESALIRLERRSAPPVDVPSTEAMFAIVRAGFAQRRKMLRSALRPVLGTRTEAVLTAAGVRHDARAETLGLDEWAAVAREAA